MFGIRLPRSEHPSHSRCVTCWYDVLVRIILFITVDTAAPFSPATSQHTMRVKWSSKFLSRQLGYKDPVSSKYFHEIHRSMV